MGLAGGASSGIDREFEAEHFDISLYIAVNVDRQTDQCYQYDSANAEHVHPWRDGCEIPHEKRSLSPLGNIGCQFFKDCGELCDFRILGAEILRHVLRAFDEFL